MPPRAKGTKQRPRASPLVDSQTSNELATLRSQIQATFGDNFFDETSADLRFPAFDAAACKKQLTDTGAYDCQGNILWASERLTCTGIP